MGISQDSCVIKSSYMTTAGFPIIGKYSANYSGIFNKWKVFSQLIIC